MSRSGTGAHAWLFFTGQVPAVTARQLGTGLLREAIAGCVAWPQGVLPDSGSVGNLIAAPLQGRCRRDGATVFLDVGTLEPYEDQWAYLSSLNRLSPREVGRLAASVGAVSVGASVNRLAAPTSTRTRPSSPLIVHARLGASVTVEGGDLTPAQQATLKHAASMPNQAFYRPPRS